MTRPDTLLVDLADVLADLARDLPHLTSSTPTGYPTSSRGGSPRGSVLDDQGVPMPPCADPTGEVVIARAQHPDEIAAITRHLAASVTAARAARAALHKALPRIHDPDMHGPDPDLAAGEPGCTSCARLHVNGRPVWSPPYKAGLCSWCWEWRAYGPTLGMLEHHHVHGKRMNPTLAGQMVRADQERRRTKRKKRYTR